MSKIPLSNILIEKLDEEELSLLCDMYDDGTFESETVGALFEQDKQNNPSKYVGISNSEIPERKK